MCCETVEKIRNSSRERTPDANQRPQCQHATTADHLNPSWYLRILMTEGPGMQASATEYQSAQIDAAVYISRPVLVPYCQGRSRQLPVFVPVPV